MAFRQAQNPKMPANNQPINTLASVLDIRRPFRYHVGTWAQNPELGNKGRMILGELRANGIVQRNSKLIAPQKGYRVHLARNLSIISTALALALICVPGSQAQIVIGPTVSFASLTNVGGDVLVGDKDFSNFSISGNFSAGQVNVTSITENGNFGLRFSGSLISAGSPETLSIGYEVSVTNSPMLISAANLLFNGQVAGGSSGQAQVTEQVFTNGNQLAGQLFVFANATNSVLSASLPITPPQTFLNLSNNVFLTAQLPAFASISTIDQTYTQVPEPSALVLVATGFTGLAFLRRRRH